MKNGRLLCFMQVEYFRSTSNGDERTEMQHIKTSSSSTGAQKGLFAPKAFDKQNITATLPCIIRL